MNPEIILRAPSDLHIHPKIKHLIGRRKPDSDEAIAQRRSIRELGIVHPLIITADGGIMDGVERWENAKALQLPAVPCEIRDESEALALMIATEMHRRHGTKGQRAFRFAPFLDDAFEESQRRMLSGGNGDPSKKFGRVSSVDEMATELGISGELLRQARRIHEIFAEHPEPRPWTSDEAVENLKAIGARKGAKLSFSEYFTPLILLEPKGMRLDRALAGAECRLTEEGLVALRGKNPGRSKLSDHRQLKLFKAAFTDLHVRYEYWQKFDEEAKQSALASVGESLTDAPEDFLSGLLKRCQAELKRRESAGI